MKNRIEYAFTTGYTAQGLHSYLPAILNHLNRLILLNGGPGTGKSTFMKQVGLTLADRGHQVQFWLSPLDPAYIDGVYLPHLKTAIINGDRADTGRSNSAGMAVHNIDLAEFMDQITIENSRDDIQKLTDQIEAILEFVKGSLEKALQTRDYLNSRYIRGLDYNKLLACTSSLAEEILGKKKKEIHYFASAITSEGIVDFYEEASRDCDRCYVLNGPQGNCKSWLMIRIAEEALGCGYFVKYYHSGLDPASLEMIVIDSLKVMIVDGSVINFFDKPGQQEIDLYQCFEKYDTGVDELELSQAEKKFSNLLIEAVEGLIRVRKTEQKLSSMFTKAMAFERIDDRREELIKEILEIK